MTLRRLSVSLVVCLCVTNFNIDNISDTIYSRFIRLDPKVARGKTFKNDMAFDDLTFSQGHSIYLKFAKEAIFDHFWQYFRHYSQ